MRVHEAVLCLGVEVIFRLAMLRVAPRCIVAEFIKVLRAVSLSLRTLHAIKLVRLQAEIYSPSAWVSLAGDWSVGLANSACQCHHLKLHSVAALRRS
mmetsp:Transcript_34127/g.86334  ORF Transcript_34127/g.86334 Transcript_34127/m.86334 type:complete len:97 (+) Transcript_34127:596-886(+)